MAIIENRVTQCDWDGIDNLNQETLGGAGHNEEDCLKTCLESEVCNFASITKRGVCHLFETCDGIGSGKYFTYAKICTGNVIMGHEIKN